MVDSVDADLALLADPIKLETRLIAVSIQLVVPGADAKRDAMDHEDWTGMAVFQRLSESLFRRHDEVENRTEQRKEQNDDHPNELVRGVLKIRFQAADQRDQGNDHQEGEHDKLWHADRTH